VCACVCVGGGGWGGWGVVGLGLVVPCTSRPSVSLNQNHHHHPHLERRERFQGHLIGAGAHLALSPPRRRRSGRLLRRPVVGLFGGWGRLCCGV
jgi:hypothetical protein